METNIWDVIDHELDRMHRAYERLEQAYLKGGEAELSPGDKEKKEFLFEQIVRFQEQLLKGVVVMFVR